MVCDAKITLLVLSLWANAEMYHLSYLYNSHCNFAPLNTEKGRIINAI